MVVASVRAAVYMPSYELSQNMLSLMQFPAAARDVTAGGIAGLAGSVVKVPVDVLKKRLQAGVDANIQASLARFVEPGWAGVRNMYAGWTAAVLYSVPYNAVQFFLLERVKRAVRRARSPAPVVPAEHVAVGALTGIFTSIVTEPVR